MEVLAYLENDMGAQLVGSVVRGRFADLPLGADSSSPAAGLLAAAAGEALAPVTGAPEAADSRTDRLGDAGAGAGASAEALAAADLAPLARAATSAAASLASSSAMCFFNLASRSVAVRRAVTRVLLPAASTKRSTCSAIPSGRERRQPFAKALVGSTACKCST